MADLYCLDGGLLVGMQDRLPTDPREHYRTKGEIVGCNHIFCSSCTSLVRHIDGHRIWGQPLPPEDHARLYESLDPKLFNVLRPDPELFRTYLCRCQWADASGIKRLGYGDIDGWACAGHPAS